MGILNIRCTPPINQELEMTTVFGELDHVLLMAPGPSPVAPNVLKAMSIPTLGHLDPDCIKVMDAMQDQLRAVCKTKNAVTFPISGTGSAGMEATFVNLVERGDDVLIVNNGVFCSRMVEVATRLGAQVDVVECPWGQPIDPAAVKARLDKKHYKILAAVHAETSTGINNPIAAIGELVKNSDTLYLVDSVAGLGGVDMRVDEWGIDAFYSGSQKCLSVPPGLAPASFSDAAMETIAKRKTKVPNWYMDVSLIRKYWEGSPRVYHHTAPINMYYAMHQALDNLLTEGLDASFARHVAMHQRLTDGLAKLGFTPYVKEGGAPQINLFLPPAGVDANTLRACLRKEHKIEVAGGLGDLAGKVIRVGVMGEGARKEPIDRLINAIKACINK